MGFTSDEIHHVLSVIERIPSHEWTCLEVARQHREPRYVNGFRVWFMTNTVNGAAIRIEYEYRDGFSHTSYETENVIIHKPITEYKILVNGKHIITNNNKEYAEIFSRIIKPLLEMYKIQQEQKKIEQNNKDEQEKRDLFRQL